MKVIYIILITAKLFFIMNDIYIILITVILLFIMILSYNYNYFFNLYY